MLYKKNNPLYIIINVLIFFVIFIFQSTTVNIIAIKSVSPLLLLSLITAFGFYHSPLVCLSAGIICGAALDSIVADSYCFNTLCFAVFGVFVSKASNSLFNKNIKAAAALSFIISSCYFVLVWLVFHTFDSLIENSLGYLFSFSIPSAFYSSLFIFPFYYLFKALEKIKYK